MRQRILDDDPFGVKTPESIAATDVVELFVDVFTDFFQIPQQGHTFLNGPRGAGKSMMFRYLEPDCQVLALGKDLGGLPFLGVYIPIKNTDLKLTELLRLFNQHSDVVVNEHLMTVYLFIKTFMALSKASLVATPAQTTEMLEFYHQQFLPLMAPIGFEVGSPLPENASVAAVFVAMRRVFDTEYLRLLGYLRRLSFTPASEVPYSGPLVGYLDCYLPFARLLRDLSFMPNGPIFLLLDDADNLSPTQTRVLNSWVSSRTSADVSLKISAQLNYKTFRTVTGQRIDSPHDYAEINISSVYTSAKGKYKQRIREIVTKRLKKANIDVSPEEFFPPDEEQEAKILAIGEHLRSNWGETGRGARPSDDVLRYARPMFIAGLKGMSKSASTYSYAGFSQLVHISSGIVRYFLDAASEMYSKQRAVDGGVPVRRIPADVQNEVVRDQADKFLFSEFDKLKKDEGIEASSRDRLERLRNIIMALGGLFHRILLSEGSERRVFSVAISDTPSEELIKVLSLGVQYGYFHEGAIGNKEGTGRTRLYVLSRRLAPHFVLDPTSFAGYKFMTSEALEDAMMRPKSFLRTRAPKLVAADDSKDRQMSFDDLVE